jgi:hypothetical protein
MGEGLESACDYPVSARYYRRLLALPAGTDFQLHRLSREYVAALTDSLAADARLDRLDRLMYELMSRGDPVMAMSVQFSAAHVELDRGRPDRYRARLAAALRDARAFDDHYLVCQILGELADAHEAAGDADSSQRCLDEGIALAKRHRFPDQTARLLLFDADRATREGRLALAAADMREASEACEAFGGGSARLRLAIEYTGLMADAGCWDVAARSLRQLPPLERDFPRVSEADELVKYRFDADCLRARIAFAAGDTAMGSRLLAHWSTALPKWHRRAGLAKVFQEWSWGLQRAGDPAGALAVCERGLAHCDEAHVPEVAIPLSLRRARLLETLGRLSEAERAADEAATRIAASKSPEQGGVTALRVMRARLALREGHLLLGRSLLLDALRKDEARAWPETPLRQEDLEGLSLPDAVHELAQLTPAAGYGFELDWRSRSSRDQPAHDSFRTPSYHGQRTHLLYRFLTDKLLRWTASPQGVVLDTLALAPEKCLGDIRDAVGLLQTDRPRPGEWFTPQLGAVLQRLSHVLLPEELAAHGASSATIEVSPDGPLLALPFEALPVSSERGPVPLALRCDVAYVYARGRGAPATSGPALILSNPTPARDLQRRFLWAGPHGDLDGESRAARARWPDAVTLEGDGATKDAFMRLATQASCIYVADHHMMDPGAPFVGFIPLAAPPGATRDVSILESTDVRALDLSSCRLAVLASCASGAPYRSVAQPEPGLGDAFLDAGATSVITSYWDVGDDETRTFMEALMKRPELEADPAHALGQVRRDGMQGPARVPPRVWAAWSVAVTR